MLFKPPIPKYFTHFIKYCRFLLYIIGLKNKQNELRAHIDVYPNNTNSTKPNVKSVSPTMYQVSSTSRPLTNSKYLAYNIHTVSGDL